MAWTSRAGSTGTDYSANATAVPVSGYVLLATIPAKANRNFVEVQNQSQQLIQLVRDDGAGGNTTSLFLAPATVSSGQGSGWMSDTFKGRLRVYGPSSSQQVAAYAD